MQKHRHEDALGGTHCYLLILLKVKQIHRDLGSKGKNISKSLSSHCQQIRVPKWADDKIRQVCRTIF